MIDPIYTTIQLRPCAPLPTRRAHTPLAAIKPDRRRQQHVPSGTFNYPPRTFNSSI